MSRHVLLQVKYEDQLRRIPATDVKKEYGRLQLFDGDKLVGEFSEDKVEHWAFEEPAEAKKVSA